MLREALRREDNLDWPTRHGSNINNILHIMGVYGGLLGLGYLGVGITRQHAWDLDLTRLWHGSCVTLGTEISLFRITMSSSEDLPLRLVSGLERAKMSISILDHRESDLNSHLSKVTGVTSTQLSF